jgi:hypothetical protein
MLHMVVNNTTSHHIHGQQNWFDLSYVNREKEFTAEMRQQWLTIFSNSTLKTATAVTPN